MTTTVNGSDTATRITDAIAPGTRIVNRASGDTAEFARWEPQTDGCASVTLASGVQNHVCGVARDWQLAVPAQPDSHVALRDLARRMENERDEARESLQLRTNERDQARAEVQQADARIEQWWTVLEAEAERRGWCSDYDDFAEANGWRRRVAYIDAYATVEVTSELDRTEALEAVGASDMDNVDIDSGVDIEWTFDVTRSQVPARSGQCICSAQSELLRLSAISELEGNDVRFTGVTIQSQSCENCN